VIVGLQHVAIPFPGDPESVDIARQFYGEVLALAEIAVPPTLRGVVLWFNAGDQELHVFSEPSGVAANDQSRRHPCFQVDDVAAFRAQLGASGVETIDSDGDIPGRPRFFALDPFGNAIEFVEFRPDHW
jgi:catechol 2,3-dioxygenase-like lactoylglutathione lyase family enzyme